MGYKKTEGIRFKKDTKKWEGQGILAVTNGWTRLFRIGEVQDNPKIPCCFQFIRKKGYSKFDIPL